MAKPKQLEMSLDEIVKRISVRIDHLLKVGIKQNITLKKVVELVWTVNDFEQCAVSQAIVLKRLIKSFPEQAQYKEPLTH